MKVVMEGTGKLTLEAEKPDDYTLLERLRRRYRPNEPDPAWPDKPMPTGGPELAQWFEAQKAAGRNPLLLSWPIEV